MASLFDGMATILRQTSGATVVVTPPGGVAREILAIFREEPVLVSLDGIQVPAIKPFLSLAVSDAVGLVPDGTVAPGNGKTYRMIASEPSGSPASDALIRVELELV